MIRKLITVYGMTCENCREVIINGLEKVEGIQKVSVKLPNRLVEVEFDSDVITLDQIKKVIQELGYDPM
ncbi:MAG: heavy-metal-associated domain-containing protein [Candidatus Cloacimonetes bacterium]|nr:heavy-metal-associated domain-containing protein [Candidatus Cloacimonadota bacterium]